MGLVKEIVKRSPRLYAIARRAQFAYLPHMLEPELRLLPFLVPSDRLALDIGANSGVYTFALSRLATKVIAIEPNPQLATDLTRSFRGRNILVVAEAASDCTQTATLRIPRGGPTSAGLATLAPTNILGGGAWTSVEVAARPVDDIVVHDMGGVGFIKIDVEGHELAVLHGARRILTRWRPVLLIEAEERHRPGAVASLKSLLEPMGYRGFLLRQGCLTSIEAFDANRDQRLDALNASGDRPVAEYINNFIFLPASDVHPR